MTHEQRVALWNAINRVVAASGGNPGNTSVARQLAVVETEKVVSEIENESRHYLLAEEERRKLTGDALVAEDKLGRIAAIVNGAFNGESPLDREQRATKALAAVAEALGVPF